MGGTDTEYPFAITVDSSGNVYTTGYFEGTVDFDPGPESFNLTSAGADDIFISKLSNNGDFLWAKAMGGTVWDQGLGVSIDSSGNVYTTGLFRLTADFDPGPETFNLTSTEESIDIFVSKLSGTHSLSPWTIFVPAIIGSSLP